MNPASLVDEKVDHLESLVQDEINGNEQIEEPTLSPPEKVIQVNNVVNVPKTKILFWSENPNVLLDPKHALEFFPTETMSFNQKLNALTRIVLVLTLISYLFTKKPRILIVSLISLLCIFLLHYSTVQKSSEGFQEGDSGFRKFYDRNGPYVEVDVQENQYQASEPSNPLSNVMLTDYDYNPHKKPAPPSYTIKDKDIILEETKKQVQLLNPGQPNIDKKLYQDVTDNLDLEQSMRQFYSTANTTIPNDQQGFAEFCYGDMISAKEGNMFAAVRNNPRYTNH